MSSVGLVLAFAGMCLCQQQQQQSVGGPSSTQYQQQQSAMSQASFQTGSAVLQPQTKLEDIERDSLSSALGQKTVAQQQPGKSSATVVPATSLLQQQAYQAAATPQQQYYVQPYQAQQSQFYVQPYQAQQQYLAQPYQMAFDYAGVQYMIINPNAYNPVVSQMYQPYYVPAVPQPSAVPQYVTKSTSSSASAGPSNAATTVAPITVQQVEYKQQQFAVPAAQSQQEYRQQQFAAPTAQAQQDYKYVIPATAPFYQYVQQPATSASAPSPVDFSYLTRHPAAAPSAQFKAPAVSAQPQYLQYTAPQQQYQQQPQQFYYASPITGQAQQSAEQQPRVQLSAKSQFSSGIKSTTPTPYKEPFAYKFESTPSQQPQQQPSATYSTLRFAN